MAVLISPAIPMISLYHTHHAHHWWVSSCVASWVTMGTRRGWHPHVTLIFLASSSCLLITTLANSLESWCSWYWMFRINRTVRYPGRSVYFSDVHIVCTTLHLTVPHPPTCPTYPSPAVISILISRTGISAAKVKLRGDYCQKSQWISSAPPLSLSPAVNTLKALFSPSVPVIEMQHHWSVVTCSNVLPVMRWIPIVQVTSGQWEVSFTRSGTNQRAGMGEYGDVAMMSLNIFWPRAVTTVTPLQLTFVLGMCYALGTLYF